MINVVEANEDATLSEVDDGPAANELIRSVRSDVETLHAIVRALVPMSSNERKEEAIELASQAISRFADAMLYLRRLEATIEVASKELHVRSVSAQKAVL